MEKLDFAAEIKKHNITIKGIIQAGAHKWQEREMFPQFGNIDFVLIEPQKEIFNVLQERAKDFKAILFNCAISDYQGISKMYCDVVNDGMSSSLLTPKCHLTEYPDINFPVIDEVKVDLLDNLDFDREKYNVLYMDLQGNELNALFGASETLKHIDAIYTEVNVKEMYENCAHATSIGIHLSKFGFICVAMGDYNKGQSDAFFVKDVNNAKN